MKADARRTLLPTLASRPTAPEGPAGAAERGAQRPAWVTEESEYGRLRHDLGLFFRRLEKESEVAS